ncbi:MAG: cysteine desulfurase [Magnetococcales bacterium]|nr:cysteine desulfurase [Magnetococcales bacterium]MBF0439390.1 cysteine desulfurase [Magnetococcales bacterium]
MIYLDHNATSPLRPGIAEVVFSALSQLTGNPSSVHGAGRASRQKLDEARRAVAALVEVHESRVVFTSGGSESNNLALFGVAAHRGFQGTILTSSVEHPSILSTCEQLAHRGMKVIRLPVDSAGRVDPADVAATLDKSTVLVSIMAANNETGVLQPIAAIGAICRQAEVLFHTDATQWMGKIPLLPDSFHVDLLTLSAHKLGGPKGTGALIVGPSIRLEPHILGGGQERGRRAGTENLPGIVGFGAAATQVKTAMTTEAEAMARMQQQLEDGILATLPDAVIFGNTAQRLPNTTAVGMRGVDGETLVMTLDLAGFAISSGAACSSGRTTPSHVLVAMGVEQEFNQSAVRISLGWDTSAHAVDLFINAFSRSVNRLRKGSHF